MDDEVLSNLGTRLQLNFSALTKKNPIQRRLHFQYLLFHDPMPENFALKFYCFALFVS